MSSVVPHTGAWIEIMKHHGLRTGSKVAPQTGAWIEI